MRYRFGYAGWAAIDGLGLGGPLYVRAAPAADDGRLQIVEFYLDLSGADTGLRQQELRSIPLTQIEAFLNANKEKLDHAGNMTEPGPDLSTLASYFQHYWVNYEPESQNWVELSFASQQPDRFEDAGYSTVPVVEKPDNVHWNVVGDVEFRLSPASPSGGLTANFLSDVARAYSAALTRGERPNKSLSEQTGYDVRSAQRWVYMARKQGLMPPARPGRAG